MHVVDRFALCDPLLARLPPLPGGRIGHFSRAVPAGYLETLASGTNHIANLDTAIYYDRIRLIVSGPVWSRSRFRAMVEVWFQPIAS